MIIKLGLTDEEKEEVSNLLDNIDVYNQPIHYVIEELYLSMELSEWDFSGIVVTSIPLEQGSALCIQRIL